MYNLEVNNEKWIDINDFPYEEWKAINEFEGLYNISSFGRVKSLTKNSTNGHCKKEKILRARIDKKGYIHYALKKEGKTYERKAHRLVAQAFIPNVENKPQVNHIDGNKINNFYKNLEWCTNGENQKHSYILNPDRHNIFRENNPRKKKNNENSS